MDALIRSPISWRRKKASDADAPSALSNLCIQIATRADRDTPALLAAQALELSPNSLEALELLERETPASDTRVLRARYEAFLAQASGHPAAGLVRDRLTALLFDHGLVYSALLQVDASLGELAALGPAWDRCAVESRVQHATLDPDASLDELERYLAGASPYGVVEAAE